MSECWDTAISEENLQGVLFAEALPIEPALMFEPSPTEVGYNSELRTLRTSVCSATYVMDLASLRNAPGMIAYAPEQLSIGAKKGFLN